MADINALSGFVLPRDQTVAGGAPRLQQTKYTNRVLTASGTAAARDYIKANATNGAIIIAPPTSPVVGDMIAFMKTDSSSFTVTFGATVNGDTGGVIAPRQWAGAEVFYNGSSWELVSTNSQPSGVTPTDLQNALISKENIWEVDPFYEMQGAKLNMTTVENATASQNTELIILDTTGPGIIESLYLSTRLNGTYDGRLRVYYDGSSTPALDMDLGTLFAIHYGAAGALWTPHMSVNTSSAIVFGESGMLIRYRMPFGTSVRVTYTNPTTATAPLHTQITFRKTATDQANGRRLRCAGARFLDQRVTRAAGDTTTLASVSGPGWLVWHSQIGGVDASNLSWLERNYALTLDGESNASISSVGTEDWFDAPWSFMGFTNTNISGASYVGADRPSGQQYMVGAATDFLAKYGGIPFSSSAVLRHLTESAVTSGDTTSWAVLYYA